VKKLVSILVVLSFIVLTNFSNAQKMEAGVQIGTGIPMGDFGSGYKAGFGITGNFFRTYNKEITLTGSLGYISFTNKDYSDASLSTIPLMVGARYALGKTGSISPYVGLEVGFHFVTLKISTPAVDFGNGFVVGGTTTSISETDFGYTPYVGFTMPLSPKLLLDVNLKFDALSANGSGSNFLGINAGVNMAL
jgi:opacity protein-like surface antigen